MNRIKPYLNKILYIVGIIIIISIFYIAVPELLFKDVGVQDVEKIENSLIPISTALGVTIELPKPVAETFTCDKEKLPTEDTAQSFWKAPCTNKNGKPFVGLFWEKGSYKDKTFHNAVLDQLVKNNAKQDKATYTASTTCSTITQDTPIKVTKTSCNTTMSKDKSLYTNFISLDNPLSLNNFVIKRILVVSGQDKKEVDAVTAFLIQHTKITNTVAVMPSFVDKAHASEGGVGEGVYGGDCFAACICTGICTPPITCPAYSGAASYGGCNFYLSTGGGNPGDFQTSYSNSPAGYSGSWTFFCDSAGSWQSAGASCIPPAAPSANKQFQ